MKMTGNNNLDERQKKILGEAMAIAAIIAFIYEIGVIIYTFYKTGSIQSVLTEIILLVNMFIMTIIFYMINDVYDRDIEKVKKGKGKIKVDEREKLRRITSIGWTGIVAIIYSIGVILVRFVETKTFQSSYLFIGLVVIMSITITLYHIIHKEYHVPKTFFGKELPLGNSKENKRARMAYYIKDAVRLAAIFLVFDIMNPDRIIFSTPAIIDWKYTPYILEFFRRVILFVIMDYAWGEFNIRKKRKYMESLEDNNVEDL